MKESEEERDVLHAFGMRSCDRHNEERKRRSGERMLSDGHHAKETREKGK